MSNHFPSDAGVVFRRHPDPMWVYSLESLRFLEVNEAAIRAYGYSRDEFMTMTIRDIRPAEDIPVLEANVRAVTDGMDEAGLWRHRRRDGGIIIVSITSETIDYAGRRAKLVVARDVSTLVAARREVSDLREQLAWESGVDGGHSEALFIHEGADKLRRRLHKTLENMNEAFVTLDAEFRITYANSAFAALTHIPVSRLLYRSAWACFPGTEDVAFGREFKRALYSGEPTTFTECDPRLGVWLCVSVYPVPDGLAINVQDVTERREIAQRMEQSQRLEAIGQLTGGVAHDFNNLLTIIIGNTEMLLTELVDDPLHDMVQMTAAAATRASDLTSRLLSFSRRQPQQAKSLDINQLIRGVYNLLRRTIAENIELNVTLATDLPPALVDPAQLESALLNLAINARDAMPQGGHLSIETRDCVLDEEDARKHPEVVPGAYVQLSVTDTGHGMSRDAAAKAFEPFFTTKPSGQGTGLGLSTVHGFVKQSGGHISIESELNVGTVVNLYFPQIDSTETRSSPEMPTGSTGENAGRGEHILVVEDDDLVREHVVAMLYSLGYRVSSAASGPEAIALLAEQHDIDLLFTDVIMPGGLSGPEVAAAVRERLPHVAVLYTSGYTEKAFIRHGEDERSQSILKKPYRKLELAQKLRETLGE